MKSLEAVASLILQVFANFVDRYLAMKRKAQITSPEEMSTDQRQADMTMSPNERVESGLRLSEFALSLQQAEEAPHDDTISWIVLHPHKDRKQ